MSFQGTPDAPVSLASIIPPLKSLSPFHLSSLFCSRSFLIALLSPISSFWRVFHRRILYGLYSLLVALVVASSAWPYALVDKSGLACVKKFLSTFVLLSLPYLLLSKVFAGLVYHKICASLYLKFSLRWSALLGLTSWLRMRLLRWFEWSYEYDTGATGVCNCQG